MYAATTMQAANENGYDSFYEGKRQNDNPHSIFSDLFRAWDAGWLQAKSVYKEMAQ